MMRYQRVSPDILPLSNGIGRKASMRTCKEEDADHSGRTPSYSHFEGKSLRARSSSGSAANPSPTRDHHFTHFSFTSETTAHSENQPPPLSASNTPVKFYNNHHEINGDVLLQWGQNKRSRGSRAESRAAAAAASIAAGDESSAHSRQTIKIQRRSAIAAAEKVAVAAAAMPPPCGLYTRGANLRPCMPVRDATGNRGVEERSGGLTRSDKRSPPSPPEKAQKTSASTTPNGSAVADVSMNTESKHPSDQETSGAAVPVTGEKLNLDQFEWPRIYISLSRKEKEDDFLAMKGTKLPQRPKKRAKNIDKTLQYCFPGMWLSDLTKGRYEVREKRCAKKRRRGLKGMESIDSDSE